MDQYCGSGGIINSGGQWPIPNCGGPMCHHGPGPGLSSVIGQGPGQGQGISGGGGGSLSGLMGSGRPIHNHGPPPPPPPLPQIPPPMCNPCSSNNFNSMSLPPGPSRWGPRTSCPIHSPFRVRVPNGNICSGHQVNYLYI